MAEKTFSEFNITYYDGDELEIDSMSSSSPTPMTVLDAAEAITDKMTYVEFFFFPQEDGATVGVVRTDDIRRFIVEGVQ